MWCATSDRCIPRPVVNRWASQLDITDVAVSNVLSHTVTDLGDHPITNEHDYEVQVLAESGAGFGPYSKHKRFIVKAAKKYTLAPAAAVEGENAEMTVILGQNAPEGRAGLHRDHGLHRRRQYRG